MSAGPTEPLLDQCVRERLRAESAASASAGPDAAAEAFRAGSSGWWEVTPPPSRIGYLPLLKVAHTAMKEALHRDYGLPRERPPRLDPDKRSSEAERAAARAEAEQQEMAWEAAGYPVRMHGRELRERRGRGEVNALVALSDEPTRHFVKGFAQRAKQIEERIGSPSAAERTASARRWAFVDRFSLASIFGSTSTKHDKVALAVYDRYMRVLRSLAGSGTWGVSSSYNSSPALLVSPGDRHLQPQFYQMYLGLTSSASEPRVRLDALVRLTRFAEERAVLDDALAAANVTPPLGDLPRTIHGASHDLEKVLLEHMPAQDRELVCRLTYADYTCLGYELPPACAGPGGTVELTEQAGGSGMMLVVAAVAVLAAAAAALYAVMQRRRGPRGSCLSSLVGCLAFLVVPRGPA